jgi:hypothetical protein
MPQDVPDPTPTLPDDWSFELAELSSGFYQVDGSDASGRFVSMQGTDPDELLAACRLRAASLVESRPVR